VKLNVNIDHVATLRNARGGWEPDPVHVARAVERAGAHGITFHLREDRRHIQDEDVKRLRRAVHIKLNMEMAATLEMLTIAEKVRPDWATLVPEKRQELTTEGGLDVRRHFSKVVRALARLKRAGIVPGVFIDPSPVQVKAAKQAGAEMVELHTGSYAEARTAAERRRRLTEIRRALLEARRLDLRVNVGHGLNYHNVKAIARLQGVQEASIGHSIVARAVEVGMTCAVREMLGLLR